tara:strand:+ start:137 stop:424 length:288 start_codon:yes stop_codon:yes gene_type:complete
LALAEAAFVFLTGFNRQRQQAAEIYCSTPGEDGPGEWHDDFPSDNSKSAVSERTHRWVALDDAGQNAQQARRGVLCERSYNVFQVFETITSRKKW